MSLFRCTIFRRSALPLALILALACAAPSGAPPRELQASQEESQQTARGEQAKTAPPAPEPAVPRDPKPVAAPSRPQDKGARTTLAGPDRRRAYLERAHRQIGKLAAAIRLDEARLGSAALSSAALAATGHPTRDDAVRWTAAALDACTEGRGCDISWLALQRVGLQYPDVLPPKLRQRLRAAASRAAAPPGDHALRNPWGFQETENQRIVRMARNVVAFRLDPPAPGTPRAAAEKAWTEAAEAFLLAHDRESWYEAESPGYIAASMTGLLHLTDHAGSERLRELAARQLNLLFAEWAQEQVRGFPAGAKSRTYVHWALGPKNTPWLAWAWLAAGIGDPEKISFMDWPEIATSAYAIPRPVADLLSRRDQQPPYEIRARRSIRMDKRQNLDTALYSFATPDYILGTAQAVDGLRLGVSGGQEILATLFASCADFAPLYLWSRTQNPRSHRWKSWAGIDLTVGHRNVALARLGVNTGEEGTGHAYLSPPWSPPETLGEDGNVVVSRCGDTYAALVTAGGWRTGPAPDIFPGYYAGDKSYRGSWAAVPRRQPAAIALEVGRRAEHGDFESWKRRVANTRLRLTDPGELRFTASDGSRLAFLPGERATVDGRPLAATEYPRLAGPFLTSEGPGRWSFSFDGFRHRFEPLQPRLAP